MKGAVQSPEIARPASGRPEPGPRFAPVTPSGSGLSVPPVGWWAKVHCGLLLVALLILVAAGQGQHFFYDEWAFLGSKLDSPPLLDSYLLPHNEHWSTVPLLAYRVLRTTVGVGSYWPYLGLLLVLHLGATHILWRLMLITGSGPMVATALAAVFSVFGGGAEDLVWAFQIGFVGSTLIGLSSVYLAVTGTASWRRTGLLTCLTLTGLATSGVSLAYLVVVPLVYAWRRWRHALLVFCVPLLVYLIWYSLYGLSLTHSPKASATFPLMVGAFVLLGLASTLTKYFGFESNTALPHIIIGMPILAGLVLACRGWVADRTPTPRPAVALCVGAVAFLAMTGLARSGLGLVIAVTSRYVYVAMAMLLPGVALLISVLAGRHPRLITAVVPVAIVMSASNIFQLMAYAEDIRGQSTTSIRVLVAATDLAKSNSPTFIDQPAEPVYAPDLSIADLRGGRLAAALRDGRPGPTDRLTASLNLQVRVAPEDVAGTASTCGKIPAQRVTVQTSAQDSAIFSVSADSVVAMTLHESGSTSADRLIVLGRGSYRISTLREHAALTLASPSPTQLLVSC